MKLEDGKGTGKVAEVNSKNKLMTEAVIKSEQHSIAIEDQATFQVSGEIDIAATEKTVLTLKNTHATKNLVITYMRIESIGAAASNAAAYFNINLGGTYSSGGTAVTSTNMFVDSPVTSTSEAYEGSGTDIVMAGTPVGIDRSYQSNTLTSYSKEGSIIVPKNSSINISHKGSTVAGVARARISYYMD